MKKKKKIINKKIRKNEKDEEEINLQNNIQNN